MNTLKNYIDNNQSKIELKENHENKIILFKKLSNSKFKNFVIENLIRKTLIESSYEKCVYDSINETAYFPINNTINEAEYKGREVKLNKPMRGDVKKYKVYVKNPKTGNVIKRNFGDPNMEIKRDNPKDKKKFRKRFNCKTAKDKTTARYWSCKFWGNKPVAQLLNEILTEENVEMDKIPMREELCPIIFDENEQIHLKVRTQILKNVVQFLKESKLSNVRIHDVVIVGSLANYNYSDESDLDVHIVIDYSELGNDEDLIRDYLIDKKNIWNQHDIKIGPHPVEIYVEDVNDETSSAGKYSVIKQEWLDKPSKKLIKINIPHIETKVSNIMYLIDKKINEVSDWDKIEMITKIIDMLKRYRASGLHNGEYSTENLVYKLLRRKGYINKLYELKKDYMENELTMESLKRGMKFLDESVDASDENVLKRLWSKVGKNTLMFVGVLAAFVSARTLPLEDIVQTLQRIGINQENINQIIQQLQNIIT